MSLISNQQWLRFLFASLFYLSLNVRLTMNATTITTTKTKVENGSVTFFFISFSKFLSSFVVIFAQWGKSKSLYHATNLVVYTIPFSAHCQIVYRPNERQKLVCAVTLCAFSSSTLLHPFSFGFIVTTINAITAQFSCYFHKILLFLLLFSRLQFFGTDTGFTEYGFWRWFMVHKRRRRWRWNDFAYVCLCEFVLSQAKRKSDTGT